MKILKLDLTAFGPFNNKTLDLSAGQFGLHLVYGPNEAGKSSTLRALLQVLFGIDRQTSDDFRVPYRKLQLGATLENAAGETISFVRLKRDKQPLRTLTNQPLPDDCLEPFLGHIDRATFLRQFGLDWRELVKGGEEMVRSEGELGRILFAAGSGFTALTQVQEALQAEMQELFLRAGSKPKINDLVQKYQQAVADMQSVRVTSQNWKRHHDGYLEATRKEQQLRQQKQLLERSHRRLERIQNAKRSIQKYRDTQRELAEIAGALVLPPEFATRRQKLSHQLTETRASLKATQKELVHVDEEAKKLSVNQPIIDRKADIETLYTEIKFYLESVKDCPGIEGQRAVAEAEAQELLKRLRPGFPIHRADEIQIATADATLIREMAGEHELLLERERSTAKQVVDVRLQIEQLSARQAEQTELPNLEPLRLELRRITQRGPIEQDRETAEQQIQDFQQRAQDQCARLYFGPRSFEEFAKVKAPLRQTITQFQSRFEELRNQCQERQNEQARLQSALQQNIQELRSLELNGQVPTEEDLQAARELRNLGWELIRDCWRNANHPELKLAQFLAETEATDLEAGFQNALEQADNVSDRIRQEISLVNQKKRLLADREKLQAQVPLLEQHLAACQQEWLSAEKEWNDLWSSCHIQPGTPSEMLEWREDFKDLTELFEELNATRRSLDRLNGLIEGHRQRLAICLTEVAPQLNELKDKPLPWLIETAERLIDETTVRQHQQTRLAEDIQKLQEVLPKLLWDQEIAHTHLSSWRKKWGELMKLLGRTADTTPKQASEMLDVLDQLSKRLKEEAGLLVRVRDMQRVNRSFEKRVADLVEALDWQARDASPTQIVGQLHEELQRANDAYQKLRNLEAQRSRLRQECLEAERRTELLQDQLRQLCQEANCQRPEDLPVAEQRSARRISLENAQRESREQILDFASDTAFEDFLKEADAEDADELNSKLSNLVHEIDETEAQRTRHQELALLEKQQRDQHLGSSQAAEAAVKKQTILAELGGHLERYVHLRIGLEALKEGAERYRKKHQGPVLERASTLFRQLTCNSFLRLQNEADNHGHPHLVGIRRHDGMEETVELKGMSDGTADQLYLALRIASLEDWLLHHPPVPLVLDDILINFDDQRAIAALKVLGELSRKTQIIFFTHHQHLLELAETHLPGDVGFTHDLVVPEKRSLLSGVRWLES